MSNTKLFYSYKDTENTGKVPVGSLSSYSDSIIFDENNRRIWHNGKQYGNTYWGTKHGETFNDLENNYAYNYAHAEGKNSYAGGEYSHVEGINNSTYSNGSHVEGKNNIAYAQGSHVEGFKNVSRGEYSHAEGENSYAGGRCSHTEGLGTIAYNSYESAFGQYNESIESGDNSTIYSIGDGKSKTQRHNIIDFRKNGDMHKNGTSYFHDDIYGPVSNTYVSSLGETATLDVVLSSLLTQPEYTRPDIKVQYKLSNGKFATERNYDYTETVELGTYFVPEFKIIWPTRKESTSGTRAYDAQCDPSVPNYLLGYSYGVVPGNPDLVPPIRPGISVSYNDGGEKNNTDPNACNNAYYAYGLNTAYKGATSPCYILGETTYTLFSNLKVSYLPFSYMYFQQLYDKGVYVHAMGLPPKEWLKGGVATLGSNQAVGRLKYFWGFSGTEYNQGQNYPKTIGDLRGPNWGWLPISSDTTISKGVIEINTKEIGASNASKHCFWIAYPDSNDSTNTIKGKHYKLVAQSSSFKIKVKPKAAPESDLIGDINKLKYAYFDNVTLGNTEYKTRYKIAYIDFQSPIGFDTHSIIFKIATKENKNYSELPESN